MTVLAFIVPALLAFQEAPDDKEFLDLPLPPGAIQSLEDLPFIHRHTVRAVTASKTRMITFDADGCINGWERDTAKLLYRPRVWDRDATEVKIACSRDDRWAALVFGQPPLCILFDAATGREVRRIKDVSQAAFSADGVILALLAGKRIQVWHLEKNAELPGLGSLQELRAIAVSDNGSRVAAIFRDTYGYTVWERSSGRVISRAEGAVRHSLATALAFSPDGTHLAVGTVWETDLWSTEKDELHTSLDAYGGPPLRFSPDGVRLVGVQGRKVLGIWNLKTKRQEIRVPHRLDPRGFIEVSEVGDAMIRVSGRKILLTDLTRGQTDEPLPSRSPLSWVGFSATGEVLTAGGDGKMRRWSLPQGELVDLRSHPELPARAISRDGRTAILAAVDGTLAVYDVEERRERMRTTPLKGVRTVAWSADERFFAVGTVHGLLSVWDLAEGRERARFQAEGAGIAAVALAPNGKSIAWAVPTGEVVFAEPERGADRLTFKSRGRGITALVYSPDSRSVISGEEGGELRLWADKPGVEPRTLATHNAHVTALAFSSDGRWIASAAADRSLKLIDLSGKEGILDYRVPRGYATSLAFSPDLKRLATGGSDGTALVWRVPDSK